MYHKGRITFCLACVGACSSYKEAPFVKQLTASFLSALTHYLSTIFCTQVAAKPEVEETLKSWEISETEQLLVRLQEVREKRQAQENQLRQTEEEK